MSKKLNIRNQLIVTTRMIRYNLKIIFANRFIWFLIAAFAFFAFFAIQSVLNRETIDDGTIYFLLFFPGILLIFYPSVFGIQNDDDSSEAGHQNENCGCQCQDRQDNDNFYGIHDLVGVFCAFQAEVDIG